MFLKCPLSPLHSWTFTYQSAPEPVVLHLDHKHCRLQLCLPEIGFAKVKKGENACITTWHSMTEPSALVISPSEQNIGLSLDPTSPSLSSTSILLEAALRQDSIINNNFNLLRFNPFGKGHGFLTRRAPISDWCYVFSSTGLSVAMDRSEGISLSLYPPWEGIRLGNGQSGLASPWSWGHHLPPLWPRKPEQGQIWD